MDQFQGREKDLIIFSAVRCNRRRNMSWREGEPWARGKWMAPKEEGGCSCREATGLTWLDMSSSYGKWFEAAAPSTSVASFRLQGGQRGLPRRLATAERHADARAARDATGQ